MNAFTFEQAQAWCAPHHISFVEVGWLRPHVPKDEVPFKFSIPNDTGARIALCKGLLQLLRGDSILIWYDDWGVWPSGEWRPMFDRFRQAFGINESLKERPAHFFEVKEFDDAMSFFIWPAIFLWDCHGISGQKGYSIHLSHDEFGYTRFPLKGNTDSSSETSIMRRS